MLLSYQLREYIDDTEDYINIQVQSWTAWIVIPEGDFEFFC